MYNIFLLLMAVHDAKYKLFFFNKSFLFDMELFSFILLLKLVPNRKNFLLILRKFQIL